MGSDGKTLQIKVGKVLYLLYLSVNSLIGHTCIIGRTPTLNLLLLGLQFMGKPLIYVTSLLFEEPKTQRETMTMIFLTTLVGL